MTSSSYFSSPSRVQRNNNNRRYPPQTSSPSVGRFRRNLVAARTPPSKSASFSAATAPINPRSGSFSTHSSIPLGNQTQGRSRRGPPPRNVTPNSSPSGFSHAWEDAADETSSYSSTRYSNRVPSSDRSVSSTSEYARAANNDMPMDELMDSMSVQSMPIRRQGRRHRRSTSASISMDRDWSDLSSPSHRRNLSMEWDGSNHNDYVSSGASVGHRRSHSTSNVPMDWNDDVSSLGGVEDNNGLGRMIVALKHRSISRPSHLNSEERLLWETIQTAMGSVRNEQISNKRRLERLLQDATRREAEMERKLLAAEDQLFAIEGNNGNSNAMVSEMESKLLDAESALKTKEGDHERELRAIQRVLAEMSSQRAQETAELNQRIESLTKTLEAERQANKSNKFEQDYEQAKINLSRLENENIELYQEIDPLKKELEDLNDVIADLKEQNQKLEYEVESNKRTNRTLMSPPKPTQSSDAESVSSEEVESLQRNLSETTSSLENAKMIIASLENASGSLALDLRGKLKAKEQELAVSQNESADSKRRLDILATELRDLQKSFGDTERAEKKVDDLCAKQRVLVGQLEKHITSLQSASVVHEVSLTTGIVDSSNVDQIGEILNDTLSAMKSTLDSNLEFLGEFDSQTDAQGDGKDTTQMRRLEDAIKKQSEEMKRLRAQLDDRNQGNDQANQKLKAEVQTLREQCASNMEALAKKEQELSVLRSSLDVDELDGGYISDDASEGDEEGDGVHPSVNYDAAGAEALVSILSQSGGGEVENLKLELRKAFSEKERASKDLQLERESLANAKMIISSLETANKSMVEDLRSRLQSSNSAIASLLNQSEESKKRTSELKEEVKKLKKEKKQVQRNYEAEIRKLQVDAETLEPDDSKPGTEEKKEDSQEVVPV